MVDGGLIDSNQNCVKGERFSNYCETFMEVWTMFSESVSVLFNSPALTHIHVCVYVCPDILHNTLD